MRMLLLIVFFVVVTPVYGQLIDDSFDIHRRVQESGDALLRDGVQPPGQDQMRSRTRGGDEPFAEAGPGYKAFDLGERLAAARLALKSPEKQVATVFAPVEELLSSYPDGAAVTGEFLARARNTRTPADLNQLDRQIIDRLMLSPEEKAAYVLGQWCQMVRATIGDARGKKQYGQLRAMVAVLAADRPFMATLRENRPDTSAVIEKIASAVGEAAKVPDLARIEKLLSSVKETL